MSSDKIRLVLACMLAVMADLLQVILFPLMFEGFLSPLNDIIDFAVAALMTMLLGWHWVFLPSAVGKLVPGVDIAPFWTAAVFWVLVRGKKKEEQPPLAPPHDGPNLELRQLKQ
jgi:hypothetical protein